MEVGGLEGGKETVEEGAGQLMEGQEGKEMVSSPVMSAVRAPSPSPGCIPRGHQAQGPLPCPGPEITLLAALSSSLTSSSHDTSHPLCFILVCAGKPRWLHQPQSN